MTLHRRICGTGRVEGGLLTLGVDSSFVITKPVLKASINGYAIEALTPLVGPYFSSGSNHVPSLVLLCVLEWSACPPPSHLLCIACPSALIVCTLRF